MVNMKINKQTSKKERKNGKLKDMRNHGYGLVYFQNVNEFEHIRRLDESVVLTVHKTKTAS
ncbi:Uncharacterized protein APZ42_000093 [Daphnia magna]|uniref:Uncharacterized protein n=1 Tax=Daphnia magna TaxID=35525 RepID=A0A162CA23_9CRUS|nr:Uncharacterized protein APZ42_000093 [Daphnia magna]